MRREGWRIVTAWRPSTFKLSRRQLGAISPFDNNRRTQLCFQPSCSKIVHYKRFYVHSFAIDSAETLIKKLSTQPYKL